MNIEKLKKQIMNEFFQTPYHNLVKLQRIAAMYEDYLAYEKSQMIMDILYLCKGLRVILEENDFEDLKTLEKLESEVGYFKE